MKILDDNHYCVWREKAEELTRRIEQLERMLFGKRKEKLPSVKKAVSAPVSPEAIQETRQERRSQRNTLPEVRYEHKVKEDKRHCPKCGSDALKPVGQGKITHLIEYVPAHLERQTHVQETLACSCGDYLVTADAPIRPVPQGHYGPKLMADVVVKKCVDSIPLYRMEKQFRRSGLNMSRSSLCNLFHQTAEALKPIYQLMLDNIPGYALVLADETPLPVQAENKAHKGFIWSFINDDYILYRYSRTRSGFTPVSVLKDSIGTLLADAYSGYNAICTPDRRTRAGCFAHVRRKFFEAQGPESEHVLGLIKELYKIEYEAVGLNIAGTLKHLELRQKRSSLVLEELLTYLDEQEGLHLPKSLLGRAIGYAKNNWLELNRFLEDPHIPLDNNASERALRIIALGRKNYLFAGNDEAAENLAGLYSLVATCELNDINPEHYLADVLIRVHTHPQKELNDLLPHRWKTKFA